ncbi:MAG: HK97 family phage prohead protease [Propioniciclava sp.]|uniref:HK97 family phage prohead protease n=1 Tax=Propioniciclava sp. TaxID=2038686 RepID=UPI0039E28AFF
MTTAIERAQTAIAERTILTRNIEIRALATTAREFDGLGVPWDTVVEHWFGPECFDVGSVELADPALVMWRHDAPIGRITAGADIDTGYHITGRLSDTTLGREAATLLDDGVITRLSIGFEPVEYRVDEDDVLHWTRVIACEFSLVPFPAYDTARIDTIRNRKETQTVTTTPTDTDPVTRADITALNTGLDELTRRIATINAGGATARQGHQWRTMGDYLKALAAGDTAAADFHRAYTGGTLDDAALTDTFIGDFIKLVTDRRFFVNMFTTGALPDKGNSVDYRQLDTNTITVAEQTDEGDDLTGPGKIKLKRANAPVKTDGGWFQLTLQEILRGSGIELTTSWEAAAIAYAKRTNERVKATFLARIAALISSPTTGSTLALPAAATADQWLDALVDAVETFDDRGFNLTGLATSKAVFKTLLKLKDGDRRLMNVYGDGVNQVGEINIPGLSGDIARVGVRMMPKVAGDVASLYDQVAIKFLEAPGSPAHLQDDNIINLSKSFSLYGFNATLEPFPSAILPIEFGA